jgi:hypothetical protein
MQRETCSNAALFSTNSKWIALGANPGLLGKNPATSTLANSQFDAFLACLTVLFKHLLYNIDWSVNTKIGDDCLLGCCSV